jgi:hypothetical protein
MEQRRQRVVRADSARTVRVRIAFKNAPIGPPSVVVLHPRAEQELAALGQGDPNEWKAVATVIEKLKAMGPRLGYPHSSSVRGPLAKGTGLRELRPRRGASPTRPLYCRIGDIFVILAIGPEAQVSPKGFEAAIAHAIGRVAEIEVA